MAWLCLALLWWPLEEVVVAAAPILPVLLEPSSPQVGVAPLRPIVLFGQPNCWNQDVGVEVTCFSDVLM